MIGLIATTLAALGIYGLISYTVKQSTHEIGIRMALGAQSPQVLRMVLKQGLILSLVGVLIGLAASLAATRILANFLFAVRLTIP